MYGLKLPCVVSPFRVTLKAFALLSRNVLFWAPLVLVVFSSRLTYLKYASVTEATAVFRLAITPWSTPLMTSRSR